MVPLVPQTSKQDSIAGLQRGASCSGTGFPWPAPELLAWYRRSKLESACVKAANHSLPYSPLHQVSHTLLSELRNQPEDNQLNNLENQMLVQICVVKAAQQVLHLLMLCNATVTGEEGSCHFRW
jgi:hypothetical protein